MVSYTHKHTHTQRYTEQWGAERLTQPYKYILTQPVMYSQQLSVLHGMNKLLISKIWYQCLSTMSFLFKNYSLVEVIYMLIRFNKAKFFQWNTNNTNRNGVNKQKTHTHTHTHTTQSEEDNNGKG